MASSDLENITTVYYSPFNTAVKSRSYNLFYDPDTGLYQFEEHKKPEKSEELKGRRKSKISSSDVKAPTGYNPIDSSPKLPEEISEDFFSDPYGSFTFENEEKLKEKQLKIENDRSEILNLFINEEKKDQVEEYRLFYNSSNKAILTDELSFIEIDKEDPEKALELIKNNYRKRRQSFAPSAVKKGRVSLQVGKVNKKEFSGILSPKNIIPPADIYQLTRKTETYDNAIYYSTLNLLNFFNIRIPPIDQQTRESTEIKRKLNNKPIESDLKIKEIEESLKKLNEKYEELIKKEIESVINDQFAGIEKEKIKAISDSGIKKFLEIYDPKKIPHHKKKDLKMIAKSIEDSFKSQNIGNIFLEYKIRPLDIASAFFRKSDLVTTYSLSREKKDLQTLIDSRVDELRASNAKKIEKEIDGLQKSVSDLVYLRAISNFISKHEKWINRELNKS